LRLTNIVFAAAIQVSCTSQIPTRIEAAHEIRRVAGEFLLRIG